MEKDQEDVMSRSAKSGGQDARFPAQVAIGNSRPKVGERPAAGRRKNIDAAKPTSRFEHNLRDVHGSRCKAVR